MKRDFSVDSTMKDSDTSVLRRLYILRELFSAASPNWFWVEMKSILECSIRKGSPLAFPTRQFNDKKTDKEMQRK